MRYNKTKLANGLRIITVPMRSTQTVTVVIIVGAGSRYESEKEAGTSHFVEHMLFKGTKKHPSSLAITSELDAIGGEYNAFTSKDETGYYIKVDSRHLDKALGVVSDIFLNSEINPEELEKEKGSIIQEYNMYEDTPLRNIGDVFENLLYGKNPLGRRIEGYKKSLMSLKRKDLRNFMRRFYVAGNTVVCVAGRFDKRKALTRIKKYFREMKRGKKSKYERVKEGQKKPRLYIKRKETDQTHFVLGTRTFDYNHKDRFALGILSVILGGNMSSRLYTELRDKLGLTYYVRTDADSFEDCGYIATQAGVDHKNLVKAVKTVLSECKKIKEEKVSEAEIKKAKDYVKGKAVMGFESSDEVAMFFIDQEIKKKKVLTLPEVFKKIDAVTSRDIQRVAKYIFQNSKLNLAVIGPNKNLENLKKILRI